MNFNFRMILAIVLACFWIYMTWSAFSNGDMIRALVFGAAGTVLTIWRVRRAIV